MLFNVTINEVQAATKAVNRTFRRSIEDADDGFLELRSANEDLTIPVIISLNVSDGEFFVGIQSNSTTNPGISVASKEIVSGNF